MTTRPFTKTIKKVLLNERSNNALSETEAFLFGEEPSPREQHADRFQYEIDSAFQGEDGFELVKQAVAEKRPYSAALIDVRMPPGWDGVETAQRIWEVAPNLPIVFMYGPIQITAGKKSLIVCLARNSC